jgi:hypothetical protein
MKMGAASKRRDIEERNQAYMDLADAAIEGDLTEVIAAIHGIDATRDDPTSEAFEHAFHQLTIAVYNLKHVK